MTLHCTSAALVLSIISIMNEQPTRQQTLRQQEEVGYVLLEECHILIPKNVHDDNILSSSLLTTEVWHGINIIQQKDDTINNCKDDDDGRT